MACDVSPVAMFYYNCLKNTIHINARFRVNLSQMVIRLLPLLLLFLPGYYAHEICAQVICCGSDGVINVIKRSPQTDPYWSGDISNIMRCTTRSYVCRLESMFSSLARWASCRVHTLISFMRCLPRLL